MFQWFMKEKRHSNVTFVTTAVLKRMLLNHMLHLFMLNQFMEEKKLNDYIYNIKLRSTQ